MLTQPASAAGATPQPHTIVGTAVINATDEGSPGLGAVLSHEGILRVAPGTTVTNFVVDLAGGDPGRAALADLEAAYGPQLSGPVQQPVDNLRRDRPVGEAPAHAPPPDGFVKFHAGPRNSARPNWPDRQQPDWPDRQQPNWPDRQ